MNFLPTDYKAPEGKYYSFEDGENTFRVLSSAITGWEYWNKDNKPVRSKLPFQPIPSDIKLDEKTGKPTTPKHFWAFVVWNYRSDSVQILQVNQKSVQAGIRALVDNEKWGAPQKYDITVTRSGSGLKTEYTVMPNPGTELPKTDISHINLEALFSGDDPFGGQGDDEHLANDFAIVPEKKKK